MAYVYIENQIFPKQLRMKWAVLGGGQHEQIVCGETLLIKQRVDAKMPSLLEITSDPSEFSCYFLFG